MSLSPVSVVVAELADVVARHRLQRPHRVPALELVVPAWRSEGGEGAVERRNRAVGETR